MSLGLRMRRVSWRRGVCSGGSGRFLHWDVVPTRARLRVAHSQPGWDSDDHHAGSRADHHHSNPCSDDQHYAGSGPYDHHSDSGPDHDDSGSSPDDQYPGALRLQHLQRGRAGVHGRLPLRALPHRRRRVRVPERRRQRSRPGSRVHVQRHVAVFWTVLISQCFPWKPKFVRKKFRARKLSIHGPLCKNDFLMYTDKPSN